MQPELYSQELDHLPIFPLPQTVFFPNTILPLHIFEPRYRKLAEDLIQQGMPLAVVKAERSMPMHLGLLALAEVAGVGKVLDHRKLPDGRYYVLLQGLGRVHLDEELESKEPYRIVRAHLLAEPQAKDKRRLVAGHEALRSVLLTLARSQPRVAATLGDILDKADGLLAATDVMAALLVSDAEERQRLLELELLEERVEAVTSAMASLLAQPITMPYTDLD